MFRGPCFIPKLPLESNFLFKSHLVLFSHQQRKEIVDGLVESSEFDCLLTKTLSRFSLVTIILRSNPIKIFNLCLTPIYRSPPPANRLPYFLRVDGLEVVYNSDHELGTGTSSMSRLGSAFEK